MIRSNLLIFALLGLLTAAAARSQEPLRPVGDEAYAVMARWFDYGPTPSALRSDELRDAANGRLYKIVFNGIGARRVPAYLELPLQVTALLKRTGGPRKLGRSLCALYT